MNDEYLEGHCGMKKLAGNVHKGNTPKARIMAFGPLAQRYANRIPHGARAIVCDGNDSERALYAATQYRIEGGPFYVAATLNNSVAATARVAARIIYETAADYDARRVLFEQLALGTLHLNGVEVRSHQFYPRDVLLTLRDFLLMGDALLVRSQRERIELEKLFGTRHSYYHIAPLEDVAVPAVYATKTGKRIVVWAPELDASELALYSFAFWYTIDPVVFVCKGQIPNTPHEFVPPERALSILADAGVIVDAQLTDPGTALAFVNRGYTVVASSSTGIDEHVQGICTYDPLDFRTLFNAISIARGKPPMAVTTATTVLADLQKKLVQTIRPVPDGKPKASIVIHTFNRPGPLRALLEVLSLQTYPNYEILVVNDAGSCVKDIVESFPHTRYMPLEKNVGNTMANYLGLQAADGEYIACIADDDAMYPNYLTNLVWALDQSQLDLAYCGSIVRLDTRLPDGSLATYGHNITHFGPMDRYELMYVMTVALPACLVRKQFIELHDLSVVRIGDYDYIAKISTQYDCVKLNEVATEIRGRDDHSNIGTTSKEHTLQEHQDLFTKYSPPNMPNLQVRQQQTLQGLNQSLDRPAFFHAWRTLNPPVVQPLEDSVPARGKG